MAIQSESFFEAPAVHESSLYSTPETNPFSTPETNPFSTPETIGEFEEESSLYSMPEASHFSTPEMTGEEEFEFEEEASLFTSPEVGHEATYFSQPEATHYSFPESEYEEEANQLLGFTGEGEFEFEYEWESELEAEADMFFGRLFRGIGRGLRKGVTWIAKKGVGALKRVAPLAARTLGSMIPGVGAIAGPVLGGLVGSLVKEAEMEVAQMEQNLTNLFAQPEVVSEAEHPEVHEAGLTELLAAEAAVAPTEAEAEANLAATLPITITIMGASPVARRVMPTLTAANARLVSTMRRQGPGGRQLLRTVPAIQRRTAVILRRAAQQGQPITPPLAVRAMTVATRRVLGNPRLVYRTIQRNALLRMRTAPLRPRRVVAYSPRAATIRRPVYRSTPTMRRTRVRV